MYYNQYSKYLVVCVNCGHQTSKQHARNHHGLCKRCAGIQSQVQVESRAERENALLIDSGYMAYARERGDYDLPDGY